MNSDPMNFNNVSSQNTENLNNTNKQLSFLEITTQPKFQPTDKVKEENQYLRLAILELQDKNEDLENQLAEKNRLIE